MAPYPVPVITAPRLYCRVQPLAKRKRRGGRSNNAVPGPNCPGLVGDLHTKDGNARWRARSGGGKCGSPESSSAPTSPSLPFSAALTGLSNARRSKKLRSCLDPLRCCSSVVRVFRPLTTAEEKGVRWSRRNHFCCGYSGRLFQLSFNCPLPPSACCLRKEFSNCHDNKATVNESEGTANKGSELIPLKQHTPTSTANSFDPSRC